MLINMKIKKEIQFFFFLFFFFFVSGSDKLRIVYFLAHKCLNAKKKKNQLS